MKDVRIGNDISVIWSLYSDQKPFLLDGLKISVYLKGMYGKTKIEDYTIKDNEIHWTFFGKDQKHTGKYSLTLVVNEGAEGMVTTDVCDLVRLVSCTCQADGSDEDGVQTETIAVNSEVELLSGGFGRIDTALDPMSENAVSNAVITAEFGKVNEATSGLKTQIAEVKESIDNISPAPMVSVTYSELVELRNNGGLIAGMQYRITDYVTTTTQENTRSAGHPFDVIVTADSADKLNEVARACLHEGDDYFLNEAPKLEAWMIWYCLDNDAERFAWADTENGKGVIYRMIDEWNNDVPYDFKNIFYEPIYSAKLKKYGSFYEASLRRVPENDIELDGQPLFAWEATITAGPAGTGIGYSLDESLSDVTLYSISEGNLEVHSTIKDVNVQKGQYTFGQKDDSLSGDCFDNIIKLHFVNGIAALPRILFGNNCFSNSLGSYCYSNSFGDACSHNSFGDGCILNSFGGGCDSVELSEGTANQTASVNSNGEVKVFNLADLADLLNL